MWGKQFSIRQGAVKRFLVSDAWKSLLNMNCNSCYVNKDWKDLVSRVFRHYGAEYFILKKFKYVDELSAGDHLETLIGYK